MNKSFVGKTADLDQAKTALAKMPPHLPMPQIAEQLDSPGISLPKLGGDSAALPWLEQPLALISQLGPYVNGHMPESWKPAVAAHRVRLRRNVQWRQFHASFSLAGPKQIRQLESIVAGLTLLTLRPMPGWLRSILMERAQTPDAWGAFLAAQGLLIHGEEPPLLECIAHDSRLMAALWQANADLAAPLVQVAMSRTDLWSATMALQQPQAGPWLGHVLAQAATSEIAAVTALTLQPEAISEMRDAWVSRLRNGKPTCACLAVRWTRFTWPPGNWQRLRDQLRATALGDHGSAWFHWFRDNEPEQINNALREVHIEALWMAELVHSSQSHGQDLRRQMVTRLRANGADKEARYVLRWLQSRGRPIKYSNRTT